MFNGWNSYGAGFVTAFAVAGVVAGTWNGLMHFSFARSDVVSVLGNLFSVLAAVMLAIYVEQRQHRSRVAEIRAYLNNIIGQTVVLMRDWEAAYGRSQAPGGRNLTSTHPEYGALFARLTDLQAGLSAARGITSVENLRELRTSHRILAALDRAEPHLESAAGNEPHVQIAFVDHLDWAMRWDRGGTILNILKDEKYA